MIPILAESGKVAIEKLQHNTFDLVLSDMQMPQMDGIELAKHIKKMQPQLPIILLTSAGNESCKENPHLFASVLIKPVKQQLLCKHILNEVRNLKPAIEEHAIKPQPNIPSSMQHTIISENLQEAHTEQNDSNENSLRILLAEDNVTNQFVAIKILSKLGYSADIAENGHKAVQMATEKHYDVILMDVRMPEMDGLEATRILRNQLNVQPVIIAMTANAIQGDKEECLQAGMNDYISKPVKVEDLMRTLHKCEKAMYHNNNAMQKAL
jgi:CheY-like chemotaxis protein